MSDIQYTWKITSFKIKDVNFGEDEVFNQVIYQTYWTKTGTDSSGATGEFSGATPLDISNLTASDFVDYSQITEQQVIDWVKAEVESNPTYNQHINDVIASNIIQNNATEIHSPFSD